MIRIFPETIFISPATSLGQEARIYTLTLLVVAAALAARSLLPLQAEDPALYLFLVPPVFAAAVLGGLGPGLFATVACVAGHLALSGDWTLLNQSDMQAQTVMAARTATFVLLGAGISWFGDRLRHTQARAAERENHLQSILATVSDAMIVIDTSGAIRSFNTAAERLFGYGAREVLGRNVRLLMPPTQRDSQETILSRYLEGDRRVAAGTRITTGQRKDGSTFPLEVSVGEMASNGERFFTGFIRDMSERQQTEARMQEMQSELVHMARLTTVGEMASALAHELNQPLSAITNYMKGSRRILAGRTDEETRMVCEALEHAAGQALRAGEIIRRLRDFVARGETEKRVESIGRLVDEAGALGLVGARDRGVRIVYALDAAHDAILADKVQIQQVLLNLMRNALEAMEGEPRRELTISTRAQKDGMLAVIVSDTGCGIEPAAMERLFQPFFTTKAGGLGVGLSICRTIVEGHGGRIRAEANPGGGTAFVFTLRSAMKEHIGDAV